METIRQYYDVLKTIFKNNIVREFIYRSNTVAMTVADMIWIAVELAFFEVIYSNIGDINGWTKVQTFFFLGIFISSDALFTAGFQRSFWNFPTLISQGDLDILLTKPINAAVLATFKELNFSQLLNLFLGFYIIHHYGEAAGFDGGWAWFGVAFWIFIGLITQYLMRFWFCIWSFWLDRGTTVSRLYYQFYTLANKPEALYPAAVRILIKTALPFAFLGSVPAKILTHRGSGYDYLMVFTVLILYFGFVVFLWKKGLKRYQSASS
jgi:ABC-2 type transport system permease protein